MSPWEWAVWCEGWDQAQGVEEAGGRLSAAELAEAEAMLDAAS
jgi:hypothetical protein